VIPQSLVVGAAFSRAAFRNRLQKMISHSGYGVKQTPRAVSSSATERKINFIKRLQNSIAGQGSVSHHCKVGDAAEYAKHGQGARAFG
jgi:hypothetical protein